MLQIKNVAGRILSFCSLVKLQQPHKPIILDELVHLHYRGGRSCKFVELSVLL